MYVKRDNGTQAKLQCGMILKRTDGVSYPFIVDKISTVVRDGGEETGEISKRTYLLPDGTKRKALRIISSKSLGMYVLVEEQPEEEKMDKIGRDVLAALCDRYGSELVVATATTYNHRNSVFDTCSPEEKKAEVVLPRKEIKQLQLKYGPIKPVKKLLIGED